MIDSLLTEDFEIFKKIYLKGNENLTYIDFIRICKGGLM